MLSPHPLSFLLLEIKYPFWDPSGARLCFCLPLVGDFAVLGPEYKDPKLKSLLWGERNMLVGCIPAELTDLRPVCPLLMTVLNKVFKRNVPKVRLLSNLLHLAGGGTTLSLQTPHEELHPGYIEQRDCANCVSTLQPPIRLPHCSFTSSWGRSWQPWTSQPCLQG